MRPISLALVLLALPLLGCGDRPEERSRTPAATASGAVAGSPTAGGRVATATEMPTAQHAPANVQPGSHEDWCGEHQVPESLCTRCNPSLVPAFKATGDWCAEHGLPESQCLACNPELKIERPPKADGAS